MSVADPDPDDAASFLTSAGFREMFKDDTSDNSFFMVRVTSAALPGFEVGAEATLFIFRTTALTSIGKWIRFMMRLVSLPPFEKE